ncbi:clasp N terminal-domain-containing protein [Gongronella butleri]|nr:clasp N terminal-domain-containing protein [Gongronella butleri]
MKSSQLASSFKLTTVKAFERELSVASKAFQGKENEHNWEQREKYLQLLLHVLDECDDDAWRACAVQGVHDLVLGIADATKSLRTKYAFAAFDVITAIGRRVGGALDGYTLETLVLALLQCGGSTKQLVATRAKDTMLVLLATTTYHNKILALLCSKFHDRNQQVRHYIATFMRTYLQVHTRNPAVRASMSKQTHVLEPFIRAALLDASPMVRDQAKHVFWLYRRHWPARIEKLTKQLDDTTKRQLDKWMATLVDSQEDDDNATIASSSTVSTGSTTRPSSGNRSVLGKRKVLTRATPTPPPISAKSAAYESSSQPRASPSPVVQLRRTKSDTVLPLENPKTPKASKTTPKTPNATPKTTTQPLASATLLHMLRSKDVATNVNALRTLAERLQRPRTQLSSSMVLPLTVPSRMDMLPILWEYLSPERFHGDLCRQLMSWECLATVFVQVFSLPHYAPSLILADDQPACRRGLRRLKRYLARHDPSLVKHLLNILLMATYAGGSGLQDRNAKKQLSAQKTADANAARDSLVDGLVLWLDELLCDHVGLGGGSSNNENDENDENAENDENDRWTESSLLHDNDDDDNDMEHVASAWFDDDTHLEECLEATLRLFRAKQMPPAHLAHLLTLISRLRLANERVFDKVLAQEDDDIAMPLRKLLAQPMAPPTTTNIDENNNNNTVDSGGDTGDTGDTGDNMHDVLDDHHTTRSIHSASPPPSYDDVVRQDHEFANRAQDNDDENRSPTPQNDHNEELETRDASAASDTDEKPTNHHHDSPSPVLLGQSCEDDVLNTSIGGNVLVDTSPPLHEHMPNIPLTNSSLRGLHQRPNAAKAQHPRSFNAQSPSKKARTALHHDSDTLPSATTQVLAPTGAMSSEEKEEKEEKDDDGTRLYEALQALNMHQAGHKDAYFQLTQLCKAHANKQHRHDNIWMQPLPEQKETLPTTTLFDLAFRVSVEQGQQLHHQTPPHPLVPWLRWIQCFLHHQSALFQHLHDAHLMHILAKTLLETKREKFNQIAVLVEDNLTAIFTTVLDVKRGLDVLKHLASQSYGDVTDPWVHPLSSLFSVMGIVVQRMPGHDLIHQMLHKKIWTDTILQGFNHGDVSVRQACVKALVKMADVLGKDQDIKAFLPSLRDEQRHLLDYYIHR